MFTAHLNNLPVSADLHKECSHQVFLKNKFQMDIVALTSQNMLIYR